MYIVDFSDSSIKYIFFKKTLLGKYEVKECGIVDTTEDNWGDQLKKVIKNEKIALVIPENYSKIIRFQSPVDTGEDTLKKEVEQQISEGEPIEEYAFDCGIKKGDGTNDVLCLASKYRDLTSIFSFVQKCDAKPTTAVPESLSIFRVLKDGIIEGEVVLLIDIEEDGTHFVFYDSTGPIEKTTQATDLTKLDKNTQKNIDIFKDKYSLQINRIVLNGSQSTSIDPFEFRKAVNILTIKADDILKDRLSKLNLSFDCGGENVGRYLNAIATGLLTQDDSSLNLVKNDVLMNVEKYAMEHKDEIEQKDEDSPSKREEDNEKSDLKKGEDQKTSNRPRLTAEPIEEEKKTGETEEKPKMEKSSPMSHTIGSPDSQFRSSFRADESSSGGGGGNKKKILLFVLVALLVAVIAGIALFMLGGNATAPTPEKTTTEEPTPSPTPTPELDRGDLSLQVLNGSGEAGLAGEVASSLEDLGYKEGIDTGNADSYDYESTVIQLKPEFEDYFPTLKKDLEGEGYIIGDDFETLDTDSDFDGVVIVGSKNEDQSDSETTPTPTEEKDPTPTPEE